MNISIKQLMDIVSLSIEAVNSKTDPTIVSRDESFFSNGNSAMLITPVENEVLNILNDKGRGESTEVASTLNQHLAAIRLGMRLSNQSEDF